MAAPDLFRDLVAHCKEYGFVFPSSEIYDGLGAVYDYGHNGVELKNNIRDYWWRSMVHVHENIVGLDAAIFMHPTVWKASGHVDAFQDPLIDNRDSKKRYRADTLVEDFLTRLEEKMEKEIERARKRFGERFDEAFFRKTNARIQELEQQLNTVRQRLQEALEANDWGALRQLIDDCGIVDPVSGTRNWTEVRQFNLMFATQLGAVSGESDTVYLRPETAQGIYVNFLNVQKTSRLKIPFGIAQVGKAFRNEIVARQFIFRMREFEQMEMQFFVRPGTEQYWYEEWKQRRMAWHRRLGFSHEYYRFKDHLKLAHYAKAACDIEFRFPFGYKELEGIHSRGDYDLSNHQKYSGKKLQYFDPDLGDSYVPYVVETSIGLDRMVLAVLSAAYCEEEVPTAEEGEQATRVVLKLPAILAPVKVAVLPLVARDGLPEAARKIFDRLKLMVHCHYEEKDTIGRRYRRQDAIGTPFAITIDQQTISDETVTLRYRDTMHQDRIPVRAVEQIVQEKLDWRQWLA
ncbi:MAG: glycine--tRNA ligase [Chitinophagales bacterium]|nr:glycine--tRNA ligase [Chitinophagales bacterium]MDW8428694.1 glycine--tRNA ligase [Chitinophagales bacterium]